MLLASLSLVMYTSLNDSPDCYDIKHMKVCSGDTFVLSGIVFPVQGHENVKVRYRFGSSFHTDMFRVVKESTPKTPYTAGLTSVSFEVVAGNKKRVEEIHFFTTKDEKLWPQEGDPGTANYRKGYIIEIET